MAISKEKDKKNIDLYKNTKNYEDQIKILNQELEKQKKSFQQKNQEIKQLN